MGLGLTRGRLRHFATAAIAATAARAALDYLDHCTLANGLVMLAGFIGIAVDQWLEAGTGMRAHLRYVLHEGRWFIARLVIVAGLLALLLGYVGPLISVNWPGDWPGDWLRFLVFLSAGVIAYFVVFFEIQ